MLPLCLFVAACALDPDSIGPGPTDFFGGSSGRVAAVACSPTDPNLYYIGAADGGVWKTTNGGTSWTPLTDFLPVTAIGALAMDPVNPSIVYAGSGESNYANHSRYGLGLFRTIDGGTTWQVLGASTFSGRCFSRILVHPTNHTTIFAAITGAGGGPNRLAAKGHPQAAGPRGLFKSTDSGETWTQVLNGLPSVDATDVAFLPSNPQIMYCCIGNPYGDPGNGLYKSTNGGASWTLLAGGLPTGVGRGSVGVCAATGRVWVAFSQPSTGIGLGGSSSGGAALQAVLRSDDNGATWTSLSGLTAYMSSQGFYNNVVLPSPMDTNTVLLGGLALRRTTNGGGAWTAADGGHPDFHAAAFDAAGRIVLGSDGGVWRTPGITDLTATPLNTGIATIQFYAGISSSPSNSVTIMGGMQDNGTAIRRATGDLVWRGVTGGDGGWTRINQSNPNIMYSSSQGVGALYRSTNGGSTFSQVAAGLSGRHAFFPPYLLDPTNPSRILYGLDSVWESTDAGSTFHILSTDLTGGSPYAIRALAMGTSQPQYVYAVTSDNRMLASLDSGHTFALRLTDAIGWPRTTREITVDPTSGQTVYLAGARFGAQKVRRSTDAGATWQNLTGDLPDRPVNVIELDSRFPRTRLFVGTDNGVWMSRDDGAHWNLAVSGLPAAPVIDLVLEPSRGRMIIATQGRAMWFAPLYCPGDFNQDESTDFFDYLDFVDAFSSGALAGDFNADGMIDFFDYLDFVDAFTRGC